MYLHLGNDVLIRNSEIIGIFDIESTTVSKNTRGFLAAAQKNGLVVDVSQELPKSFVICKGKGGIKVYISQISPSTLEGRSAWLKSDI